LKQERYHDLVAVGREQMQTQETRRKASQDQDLPPCQIHIDKEGRWFHRGAEIVNRGIVNLFYAHMEMEASGRYVIAWNGERCYVEVEDTPFVVRSVEEAGNDFRIHLSDETAEILSPETLTIGKDHVLYCRVKNGRFPARFNRPAYYQLAEHVEASGESYYLPAGGRNYLISGPSSPG
jgi:uncharacterized protein